ncbi:hypothetical protein HDU99_008567, partial [Rhizoclosmatium hyalinum]
LGMKLALHKDKQRTELARINALEIAKEVASGLRTPEASVRRSVMENSGMGSTVINTSSSGLSKGKPMSRSNLDLRQGRPVSYSGLQQLRPASLSRSQQKRPVSLAGFEPEQQQGIVVQKSGSSNILSINAASKPEREMSE